MVTDSAILSVRFNIDRNNGVKKTPTDEINPFELKDFKFNPYPFADWMKFIRLISFNNKGKYLKPTPNAIASLDGILIIVIVATSSMIFISETSNIEILMIEKIFKKSGTILIKSDSPKK